MYIFDYCFHNSLLDCVYEELEIPLIIILMQILFDRTAVVFTTKSIQHFSHSQLVILTIYMLPSARRYFVSYQMIKFCTLKKSPAVQVTQQPTIKICPKSFDHCKNPLALLKLVLALFEIDRKLPKLFIVIDVSTGAGAICYRRHCYTLKAIPHCMF